jgi:hypothetical protein
MPARLFGFLWPIYFLCKLTERKYISPVDGHEEIEEPSRCEISRCLEGRCGPSGALFEPKKNKTVEQNLPKVVLEFCNVDGKLPFFKDGRCCDPSGSCLLCKDVYNARLNNCL